MVVRVAPGRVCVGAVSRPQACFGAAAAGGLSREEEVSVSFWAWRGAALAPLTEALRLNYEAGWGPGPLSQTPPGTEAGGSPCPKFSLVTCPEGQQTDVPGTWDASPVLLVPVVKALGSLRGSCGKELAGQPSSTLLRGREEPASVHSDGNESLTPRPGLVGLRVRDPGRAPRGTSGREARHRAASWEP